MKNRLPKLPKLTDREIKELVEGARLACAGDGLERFLDEVMNVEKPIPPISPEKMARLMSKITSRTAQRYELEESGRFCRKTNGRRGRI